MGPQATYKIVHSENRALHFHIVPYLCFPVCGDVNITLSQLAEKPESACKFHTAVIMVIVSMQISDSVHTQVYPRIIASPATLRALAGFSLPRDCFI